MTGIIPSRSGKYVPTVAGEARPARSVRRAVMDARGGVPVLLQGSPPLVVVPAETATTTGLAEFKAIARGAPMLLLAPSRAAAVLHQPVGPGVVAALGLGDDQLDPETLLTLADPTRGRSPSMTVTTAPAGAEAALTLAKMGRLLPAVVAAVADPTDCVGITSVRPADVVAFNEAMASTLRLVAQANVPLAEAADTRLVAFRPADGGMEHLAVLIGRPEEVEAPLVRIHSECFTGDLLGSLRCDCGPQLHHAICRMQAEGAGVLLYMAQEGRGIGLVSKLRAYALQDTGLDTLDANRALGWGADERSFGPAAAMLKALGVTRIRLLTNNPDKLAALAEHGIEVTARVSHAIAANGVNDSYLHTKATRFGHLLG